MDNHCQFWYKNNVKMYIILFLLKTIIIDYHILIMVPIIPFKGYLNMSTLSEWIFSYCNRRLII